MKKIILTTGEYEEFLKLREKSDKAEDFSGVLLHVILNNLTYPELHKKLFDNDTEREDRLNQILLTMALAGVITVDVETPDETKQESVKYYLRATVGENGYINYNKETKEISIDTKTPEDSYQTQFTSPEIESLSIMYDTQGFYISLMQRERVSDGKIVNVKDGLIISKEADDSIINERNESDEID